MWETFRI